MFHSYINKEVSIVKDDSVQVDREDDIVNSRHGVLVFGNNVIAPFIPKYLSICLETSMQTCSLSIRLPLFPSDELPCRRYGKTGGECSSLFPPHGRSKSLG